MAIYRLLKTLRWVRIAVLTEAYEQTLEKLGLVDRSDPITQIVAKKIIEIGQRGVRDPEHVFACPQSWQRSEQPDNAIVSAGQQPR